MKEKELSGPECVQEAQVENRQEEWEQAEQTSFALYLPRMESLTTAEAVSSEGPAVGAKGKELEENKQIPLLQVEPAEDQADVVEEEALLDDEVPALETIFEDIEEIVNHLETEEVSLEESLRLFERGIRFCRSASRRLDEAESVIERLMRDPETGEESVALWSESRGKSSP